MKKIIKLFFFAIGTGLTVAQPIFACISSDSEPMNPFLGFFMSLLLLAIIFCVIFSPMLAYIWYEGHGGKNRWFALPALLLPLMVIGSFFGFIYIDFWPFSLLYIFFVPLVSYYLYVRAGGPKKLWHLSIILLSLAFLIKGIFSITMGCVGG